MNYLHPQLFFPISLFFPPLCPLVRGEGPFGPDSHGENLTVNSVVRWSCCHRLAIPIFLSVHPILPCFSSPSSVFVYKLGGVGGLKSCPFYKGFTAASSLILNS